MTARRRRTIPHRPRDGRMLKQVPNFPPTRIDIPAAVLSYLLPGLGQVVQGRIGKGFLFFFGLYGMFFYGMANGSWKNVWIPQPEEVQPTDIFGWKIDSGLPKSLISRREFCGQVWIGVAAWPAIIQYATFNKTKDTHPFLGSFQRCPPEAELNELQRNADKRWDLGWVFTVVAGMLNLLVIYDAFAGPMFKNVEETTVSTPAIPEGAKS
jgi:hypothetical protein